MADTKPAAPTFPIPSSVQAEDPKNNEYVPQDKRTKPVPSAVEPAKKDK